MKNTPFEDCYRKDIPRDVQRKRLQAVIQRELTELQRHTLLAYYLEKKTLDQIAVQRNVCRSTVCRTLKRAERRLRRYL